MSFLRSGAMAWLLAWLLAGCAGLGKTPEEAPLRPMREGIRAFSIEGRISVKRGDENYSAALAWTHIGARDELVVSNPLGQGLAELVGDASGAELVTADKQRYSASDMEALSERIFGVRLPFRDLPSWMVGVPSVAAVRIDLDGAKRPQRIFEQGWQIEYLDYESARSDALPTMLNFQRGDLDVRLKIDSWAMAK